VIPAWLVSPWLRYGAVAAVAGIVVGIAQGWRYGERIAGLERDWSQERAALSEAARRAETAARAEEGRRQAAIDEVQSHAQQELDAAVRRERAAADVRVRDAVAAYAARHRPAADPGAAPAGQAAGDPLSVLADLLGELDGLAESYAAAADRARIAGHACERAYDSLSAAP